MAKVTSTGSVSQGATFRLAPKDIKLKNSKTTLKVFIVPNPPMDARADLVATATNKKEKITFSKSLKELMKEVGWSKSAFKPLEKSVNDIMKSSIQNPSEMIALLDTNLKAGCQGSFTLKYDEPYVCQTAQTISLGPTPQAVQSLNFFWIPKEVKVTSDKVKIKLSAILSSPCSVTTGALIVTVEGNKTKLHYTQTLLEILASMNWDTSMLQPLENYMIDQATISEQNPEYPVSVLNVYLTQGYAPTISIDRTVQL